MNVKAFGGMILILGALLAAWSISSKQEARSAIAAKSMDNFIAASGQTPSNRGVESMFELQERKDRAEWLLIGGLVMCGVGIAMALAAKKAGA